MDRAQKLLSLLKDGEWVPLPDLAQRLGWHQHYTLQIVQFLSEHGLLNYRKRNQTVRIDPELRILMQQSD